MAVYARDDGLWDVEACLTDHKARDFALVTGVRPVGTPIHELRLRVTIRRDLTIVDAEAVSDWVPYPGICDQIGPAYRALIGLNLARGFRKHVQARLAGQAGCTHLTELCNVLPTAAIQAFAGEVIDTRADSSDGDSNTTPPFQLGRCHALRFDGEAVRQYYPRWYLHRPEPQPAATALLNDISGARPAAANESAADEPILPTQQEGNHA